MIRETNAALSDRLDDVERLAREEIARALVEARDAERDAITLGEDALAVRATAVQGEILMAAGAFDEAFAMAPRLHRVDIDHLPAATRASVAVFRSQLAFHSGAYRDALAHATYATEIADRTGDLRLQVSVRRRTCMVVGLVPQSGLDQFTARRLELSIELGDPWEEAIARNDVAWVDRERGRLDVALAEIGRAAAVATRVADQRTVLLDAVVATTRAEIMMSLGRLAEAADDATAALASLRADGVAHPYLSGMASALAVTALGGAGRIDEAVAEGQLGVATLGARLPIVQTAILGSLAEVLRGAGRSDEAYDALAASVALERDAAREFAQLQDDLNRALIAQTQARAEADHLRDEADRDWLTGLHNRRYLARLRPGAADVAVVVVDLDEFKIVNDTHGHDVGDALIVRVAQVLRSAARAGDAVVRLGGDEFAVVMDGADRAQAIACAERLRGILAASDWDAVAGGVSVGASIGYAVGPAALGIEALVSGADRFMYQVKRSGRGGVAGGTVDGIAA